MQAAYKIDQNKKINTVKMFLGKFAIDVLAITVSIAIIVYIGTDFFIKLTDVL